ncbi:MAG: hypothetical protein JNM17_26610 [Archangium sp.]|nr:hypothetical protein [Archangium sp.]
MLTTVLLLVHASVVIEPVGFSVVREGADVKIDWVEPKSAAAKAGLEVGTLILNVTGPAPHEGKELANLGDDALRELLTPPFFEPLRLFVKPVKGFTPRVMLSRTDQPPADYYATIPWPAERVAKLTSQERTMYESQVRLRQAQGAANPPRVALQPANLIVTVTTGPKPSISKMARGEFNAQVVTWAGALDVSCGIANVEGVKVVEPVGLPTFPKTTGSNVKLPVAWPVFKTPDVLKACATGKVPTSVMLDQVVKLELACAGNSQAQVMSVTASLMVDCIAP